MWDGKALMAITKAKYKEAGICNTVAIPTCRLCVLNMKSEAYMNTFDLLCFSMALPF